MPFQVSPGVNFSEIDLSGVIPAVSTTEGALVGVFNQGPVFTRTLIDSEDTLKKRFGGPTNDNYETWFSAANFLSYGNKLYVTRVASADANNASSGGTAAQVTTRESAEALTGEGTWLAQSVGAVGNNLRVSVCYDSADFETAITIPTIAVGNTQADFANTEVVSSGLVANDIVRVGNSSIGFQDLIVDTIGAESGGLQTVTFTSRYSLSVDSPTSATRHWRYYNLVDAAPGASNSHVVVVDEDGGISGVAETVLEVYPNLSRTSGDKSEDGTNIYYVDVINESSNYVWATGDSLGNEANYQSLTGGGDGTNATESAQTLGILAQGIDLYNSSEDVDISLFVGGKASSATANYIKDNICLTRRDCVLFVSPERGDVVQQSTGAELDQVVTFRNAIGSSNYVFMDSGYKYQYDKYNDVYRYVPCNGDIAGLCVRTDTQRDAWFSPAGYNRGILKNALSLAWSPKKAERDILYKNGINPVINETGYGPLLFGDKTLQVAASAFDRINVRRLFIVLEKAIATAAKQSLFEFNDEFTRAQFVNLTEPFLRDVKGRRGIIDFEVVCNEENNTPEVIDRNEFVADIYIKPAKSINYIQLNFVAVRTGVEFEEIIGKF